jgi:hypothetical protein
VGIKLKNKKKQPKKKTIVNLQSDTHKELDRLSKQITSMRSITSKAEKETIRLLRFIRALLH